MALSSSSAFCSWINKSCPDYHNEACPHLCNTFLTFLHNIYYLAHYLCLFIYYYYCLSLLLNCKLYKGRNFCLFCSLLYCYYFKWPVADSGFSINSCRMNKCTISVLYKLCHLKFSLLGFLIKRDICIY